MNTSADTNCQPLIVVAISTSNSASRLERTLQSIRNQTYPNYLLSISDNCSTDKTHALVQAYSDIIDIFCSEPDTGLYHGLVLAFQRAPLASIYTYINAGDIYMPYSFETVVSAFNSKNKPQWVTGLPSERDVAYRLTSINRPLPYISSFIRHGFYNGSIIPAIQQESVFWSSTLHFKIDFSSLQQFKYAGDMYLWQLFAHHSSLTTINCCISSFTVHGAHLSSNYLTESRLLTQPGRALTIFLTPLALLYGAIQRFLRIPSSIYKYLPTIMQPD